MNQGNPLFTGSMLPPILAGAVGRPKQRIGVLGNGACASLDDMKKRTALAVGKFNRAGSDAVKDLRG